MDIYPLVKILYLFMMEQNDSDDIFPSQYI